jgi:hypothetical protein
MATRRSSAPKQTRGARPKKSAQSRSKKSASALRLASPKSANELLYLYALTPARKQVGTITVPGVDGNSPVHGIACAEFQAWASRVPAAEFGSGLERKMEDLDWLAAASIRHQRVVAELAKHATVLPARFGTIFNSEQSLAADVAGRATELRSALAHVSGADEWGIKVFRVQQAAAPLTFAASGADYLKQKAARLHEQSRGSAELPAEVAVLAN